MGLPLTILADDQTVGGLLVGKVPWPEEAVYTTGLWYLRLCQAVVRGTGGQLSGPVLSLPAGQRERAIAAILELPDRIGILEWKTIAPVMASQVEGPGRGLNLLSREALAAATVLRAQVVMASGNEIPMLRDACNKRG